MSHGRTFLASPDSVKGVSRRADLRPVARARGLLGRERVLRAAALATAIVAAGCGDDGPTDPSALRFGQVGEVQLQVRVPLFLGAGTLTQTLTWSSSGPWRLTEVIAYDGVDGDQTTLDASVNAEQLAGIYAGWITEVNDRPSLSLFIESLDPSLEPECGPVRSRVHLRIRDDARAEEIAWTRCVEGPISNLRPGGAGPDLQAARVAQAAGFLASLAIPGYVSVYNASQPFATIAKGEDTKADLPQPRVIRTPSGWTSFWAEHTQTAEAPPPVDFDRDVVLVASVGRRREAGDSVEVRRVLPVGNGTIVQFVERVPGNFCSPAERTHTPYHIVATPILPEPVTFAEPLLELAHCG